MDKKPEKLVPEVRFKGFTDDWEQRKLGEVILDYKRKNNNDRLPVLTSSFQGIEYQEKHFGSQQKHDTSDYNVLPKEYMTYRNRSDNGYFRFNINNLGVTGIVSKFYPVFTTINTNKLFLASYINHNHRLKNHFKVVSVGTSQHVLSLRNFKKTNLLFPSKDEQDQIGKFFNLLNRAITLQQRKLEQLKQLKKAMLQQLFIDKKSKQPNLRFKIFNGDWEQRKFLDEIDSIIDYRGKTPKKLGMSWSKTGYLALSTLNVKNGWIDKKSKDSHFGSQALYDIWMKNTPLYKDQVVFTTEAPMGNVAQIPDNEKYILSQRTIAFNPSQRLIDGFLADLLSTKNIQNKLMSLATGGTAKGVSQKSLKFLKIAFPSNEEQNFIHKVIKLFQILITLQQNKLTQLTTLKKYLLQNLFI